MNHPTLINGTQYNITGGTTLINGTQMSIKNGKTLINGTEYTVNFEEEPQEPIEIIGMFDTNVPRYTEDSGGLMGWKEYDYDHIQYSRNVYFVTISGTGFGFDYGIFDFQGGPNASLEKYYYSETNVITSAGHSLGLNDYGTLIKVVSVGTQGYLYGFYKRPYTQNLGYKEVFIAIKDGYTATIRGQEYTTSTVVGIYPGDKIKISHPTWLFKVKYNGVTSDNVSEYTHVSNGNTLIVLGNPSSREFTIKDLPDEI